MAWPKTFEVWVSGDGNWGPMPCYFNSSLSNKSVTPGQNATLTIFLRVMLVERNAKDAIQVRKTPSAPNLVRDWAPGDFIKFKNAVKTKAEDFWSGRFCLLNNADVTTLDVRMGDKTIRPNVDCKFEIVWAESPGSAHQVINCFCPNFPADFSQHVNPSSDGTGVGQLANTAIDKTTRPFPEGATCYRDVGDPLGKDLMTREPYKCNLQLDHDAVAHEIGHLIGLPHVGVARKTHACLQAMQADPSQGGNNKMCYLGDGLPDASNIMGIGNKLAGWNANPWITRLGKHTGIDSSAWRVSETSVKPKVL